MLRHDATNSDGPAGGVMLGILVPVLAGLAPIFQTATLTLVCLQLGLPKNFNLLYMPDLDGEGTPQGLKAFSIGKERSRLKMVSIKRGRDPHRIATPTRYRDDALLPSSS